MLQAYDTIADEVYGEDSNPASTKAPYINGNAEQTDSADGSVQMEIVPRVRLVQFQKNTSEPLVR